MAAFEESIRGPPLPPLHRFSYYCTDRTFSVYIHFDPASSFFVPSNRPIKVVLAIHITRTNYLEYVPNDLFIAFILFFYFFQMQ